MGLVQNLSGAVDGPVPSSLDSPTNHSPLTLSLILQNHLFSCSEAAPLFLLGHNLVPWASPPGSRARDGEAVPNSTSC